jgi:hypothetical protein
MCDSWLHQYISTQVLELTNELIIINRNVIDTLVLFPVLDLEQVFKILLNRNLPFSLKQQICHATIASGWEMPIYRHCCA